MQDKKTEKYFFKKSNIYPEKLRNFALQFIVRKRYKKLTKNDIT